MTPASARKRLLALHDADAFWLTPLGTQHLGTDVCVWHTEAPAPETAPPPRQRTWQLRSVCAVGFGSEHDSAAARQDWERMPLMVLPLWHYAPRQQKWVAFALLTNLPYDPVTGQIGGFSCAELAAVYAQRWEREVFFKRVEQPLSLSHLISRCENGIRVLLAMMQIAALLLLWYQEQTGIDGGWRSVKFWLANDVEDWTRQVLAGVVCRPG